MARTLAELASLVGGTVVEGSAVGGTASGDSHLLIEGASPPATAVARQITLVDKAEHLKKLNGSQATAVVVPPGVTPPLPAIVVDDVHAAFATIIKAFHPPRAARRVGLSPRAVISPSARLGPNVDVHPHAVIGEDVEIGAGSVIHGGVQIMAGCKLGENVVVFPNAVLYEDTIVGSRCILHAAAILGAYGFGYKLVDGKHQLAAQLGGVEIGDDVEIGAGTTIDRGAYGPTRIGDGTKIDDQVMIAHNCVIGKHNLICSQVGIAGSSSTGDYVVIAGQAGLRDHIHIGTGAVLGAMAGVMNDVAERSTVVGIPAEEVRDFFVKQANLGKLSEMRKQLKELTKAVAELERRSDRSDFDSNGDEGTQNGPAAAA